MRTAILRISLLSTLALLSPISARAFSFARFFTLTPNQVKYLAAGAMVGQKVPVKFKFLPNPGVKGNPETGFDLQEARFSFTAVRLGNADSLVGVGHQKLRLFNFSFVLDTPIDGKSNLLSGSATTGELLGLLGANTGLYWGRESSGGTFSFASDFLDFPIDGEGDFHWALTDISPSLAAPGSNYRAFTAGMTGEFGFSKSPVANVPETSSLWLLVAGAAPFVWTATRRFRRAR
jgi:hypothetical protein